MNMKDIDFLIIGATKSATTWLQKSLQADLAVSMPDPELHYFSREYHRGDDWYFAQFPPRVGAKLVGEKSNTYLESTEAANRIAKKLPAAKLVVQLRNPVERAYSDYCMMYRRGEVGSDIERYLDPREPQETRLLNAGFYFRQIQNYYDRFPAQNILVTFYENIKTAPAQQLETVRDFLGLPVGDSASFLQKKVKDKTTPMLSPALRKALKPLKPAVAPFRKNPLFQKLHSAFSAETKYAPFPETVRQRLIEHYAADVNSLGGVVGRDLSGWLRNSAISPKSPEALL